MRTRTWFNGNRLVIGFALGVIFAVIFGLASCTETSRQTVDIPDVTITTPPPEPDIDPELEVISRVAFDQLSARDQVVVCAIVTDGVSESEIDSFLNGTSGGFTRGDARQILEYTGEVLCS